jgi:hypothetical protein
VDEHAAERVDVGARVDALVADLLGRDVAQRADPPARARGHRRARVQALDEAEVGQVRVVGAVEQDVGRLDVAVHEPARVRGVQRRGDLGDDRGGALGRQPALGAHDRPQVGPVDVAHDDVEDPVLLAGREDRDDVRMLDRRGGLGLAHEAVAERRVDRQRGRDRLEGHDAVERQLHGAVDDPHPAAARHALDPVAGEDVARVEVHCADCLAGALLPARGDQHEPAVDHEGLARRVRRALAGQPGHHRGDLVGAPGPPEGMPSLGSGSWSSCPVMRVAICPGATALTRMPCSASSIAATLVNPPMACLEAVYGALPSSGMCSCTELMLMIRPPRPGRSCGWRPPWSTRTCRSG